MTIRHYAFKVSENESSQSSEMPLTEKRHSRLNARIAILTNQICPSQIKFLEYLATMVRELRVFISTEMEPQRHWEPEFGALNVALQKTLTVRRTWRHPAGFKEDNWVHIPYDTIPQMLDYSPDVLISNELGSRTLQAVAYRALVPSCRLISWVTISESTEWGRHLPRRLLRRMILNRSDAIIVNGASGERYVRSACDSCKAVFRVPRPIDNSLFEAEYGNETRLRDQLLHVGQLVERKGLIQFLTMLSLWATHHQNRQIEMVMIGAGPLKTTIESQRLAPNIKLTLIGHVPYRDLPMVYARANILAFPTLADEWGMVVNEALASGVPVLGSNQSQAVEELIKDGANGWSFDSTDPEAIYSAIDRALSTGYETLEQMRKAAHESITAVSPMIAAELMQSAVRSVVNSTTR